MKLYLDNLKKVKELCELNPNEVITIDDINYCWVIDNNEFIAGAFRIEIGEVWETLYI